MSRLQNRFSGTQLAQWLWMSSLMLALVASAGIARAHEVQPAIADLTMAQDQLDLQIEMALEAPLAGINLDGLSDTNDAAEAGEYDRLRALPPAALEAALRDAWPELSSRINLMAGETRLSPELGVVTVGPVGDIELGRASTIHISAALPDDGTDVTVGWDKTLGGLVVRETTAEGAEGYTAFLRGGELSAPIPRSGGQAAGVWDVAANYVVAGFEHIIPLGLDHILFVLGLFFFALARGPLLWQVTAFTVAHTCTLALATLGIVNIPANWMWLVEALIAVSIVYVAVENIFRPTLGWLRPAVVFCFGLLHGLGFASVLGDFGLPAGQYVVALLAFNVGVELGQLTVILGAFLILVAARAASEVARLDDEESLVRDMPVIYCATALVGSILIALIGAYWAVERVL
ncbi:MAG: HupE/UreJ family protein [Rhodobacteraceae bacterium]|nr:HupE/UreJ family protein [Paracoccaceae bacterium]